MAVNEGQSTLSGEQIGPVTTAPEQFGRFDDLCAAYVMQVQYLPGLTMLASVRAGEGQKQVGHCPLMLSLLDNGLLRRRDLVFGGTRYNLPGICIFGTTNVYDGLAGDEGVARLADLTATFLQLGGQQLQINVMGRATLLAVQAVPRSHANPIVSVVGFSAYVVELSRAVQDEILSRTTHQL